MLFSGRANNSKKQEPRGPNQRWGGLAGPTESVTRALEQRGALDTSGLRQQAPGWLRLAGGPRAAEACEGSRLSLQLSHQLPGEMDPWTIRYAMGKMGGDGGTC